MKAKDIITESQHACPHCGGPLMEYSGLTEKKDACYYKVKASAKVWPSAYASGRLVQCRKKGAGNYGNKSESVAEGSEWETRHDEFTTVGDRATPEQINKIVSALGVAAKQASSKRGFLNKIVGRQSNGDLARMAQGAETLAKNIQRNSNAKPGTDERKELGQHLVYAVSLLKRIKGEQGVAEGWKTGATLGGLAGGLAGGPAGAVVGAGAGAIAGHLMKGKDPKTIPGYSENLTDATRYVLDHLPKTSYGELIMSARPQEMGIANHKFDAIIENDLIPEFFIKKYGEEKGPYYLDKNPKLAKALYWEIQGLIRWIIPITITSKFFRDRKLELVKKHLGDDPKYLKYFGISQYDDWEDKQGVAEETDPEIEEMYEAMEQLAEEMAATKGVSVDLVWESFEALDDHMLYETAAWRRKEGKSARGGLNAKGVASYRRENPGSKLQTAVTTKPSKLKPGSKAAKRRKSFCARMGGVKGPMKKPNGKPTRKALALRKWNC
jgi:hypothetical protein